MAEEFCSKHTGTALQIGRGKNKNRYVFCPDCRSEKAGTTLALPAGEKKNDRKPKPASERSGPPAGSGTPWYDRAIF